MRVSMEWEFKAHVVSRTTVDARDPFPLEGWHILGWEQDITNGVACLLAVRDKPQEATIGRVTGHVVPTAIVAVLGRFAGGVMSAITGHR